MDDDDDDGYRKGGMEIEVFTDLSAVPVMVVGVLAIAASETIRIDGWNTRQAGGRQKSQFVFRSHSIPKHTTHFAQSSYSKRGGVWGAMDTYSSNWIVDGRCRIPAIGRWGCDHCDPSEWARIWTGKEGCRLVVHLLFVGGVQLIEM